MASFVRYLAIEMHAQLPRVQDAILDCGVVGVMVVVEEDEEDEEEIWPCMCISKPIPMITDIGLFGVCIDLHWLHMPLWFCYRAISS